MDTRLLTAVGPLSEQTAVAVRDLVATLSRTTGAAPISEQPLLWLQDPRAHVAHILAIKDNGLVGYAQADLSNKSEVNFELAVDEDEVHHDLARQMLEAGSYIAEQNEADYSIWLHGPSTEFIPLFEERGFRAVRSLSRRSAPLQIVDGEPHPQAPADPAHNLHVARHAASSSRNELPIRTFQPGQDDEAWVRANATAFSWHPEQGRLTLSDVHARKSEDWFDPDLFLVIDDPERPGELLGFSWLKVPVGSEIGEIYAIATVPNAQGKGLGRALLVKSLEVLHAQGLKEVELYVESTNERAIRLYDAFGFTEIERHAKLTRPVRNE